jgi:hypothetical protein
MDFEPEQPDDGLFYHYCDATAFESIIRTNKLWLSPFRYSNDSEEGIRAQKLLFQLAKRYGLSKEQIAQFREALESLPTFHDCYGLCLSEDGDLLSQWRAYAADGAGFAIGFRPNTLRELPSCSADNNTAKQMMGPVLHQVAYDEHTQIHGMTPWFESMLELIRASTRPLIEQQMSDLATIPRLPEYISAGWKLNSTLFQTWEHLYMVKGEAFREEREWRLVVTAVQRGDIPFQFRVSRGMVIPFLAYAMPDRSKCLSPISHVYLGPKNRTPRYIVQMLLDRFGLEDVTVCNSKASYR